MSSPSQSPLAGSASSSSHHSPREKHQEFKIPRLADYAKTRSFLHLGFNATSICIFSILTNLIRRQGDKLFYFKSKSHLEHEGFLVLRQMISVSAKEDFKILIEFPSKQTWLACFSNEQRDAWVEGLNICRKYFGDDWKAVHQADPVQDLPPPLKEFPKHLTDSGGKVSEHLNPENDQIKKLTNIIIEKDKEIQKLRNKLKDKETTLDQIVQKERQTNDNETDKFTELQEAYDEKAEQVILLEERVKALELRLVQNRERELNSKSRAFLTGPKGESEVTSENKTQSQMMKLKEKYFFSLAMNIKMMGSAPLLDVNALYQRALVKGIEIDAWPDWIWANANDPDLSF